MTDIIGTNGKEIKSEQKSKKDFALELLNSIGEKISEGKDLESSFILIKIDGQYLRYSTGTDSVMEDIAQLELLKHDLLNRMTQSK
tara:strand:+ start:1285 stop:1542 length:258 start_codon:yes stop_codon:yes gene_type:complete